jgi:hypothetical protein
MFAAAARMPAGLALVALVLTWCAASARADTPTFGAHSPVATLTPGGSTLDLTNADFTGDGRQDVLVLRGKWASDGDYPVSILVNDGTGHFDDRAPALFGGPVPRAVWPRQALIADFNADGRPDFFVGDSGKDVPPFPGSTNVLALSTPAGGLADASGNLPPETAYFHSGAAADVDGDDDIDIFLADLGTPIRLLLNDGSGHFTTASDRFPESVKLNGGHDRYTRSEFVDVDGKDGPDLVLLAENNNATSAVLLNDGHGTFTELADALPPKPFGPKSIGVAIRRVELNGDDRPDLLLGYTKGDPFYRGRWIQVAINNGDGTFKDETATRLPQQDNDADWPYEIVLGDLDGDGAQDFGVDLGGNFCCPGRRVVPPFFMGSAAGTFTPLSTGAFAAAPFGQLRLIDVNGDNRLDVFSAWQAEPNDVPEQYVVQLAGGGMLTPRDRGAAPASGGGANGGGGDSTQPPPADADRDGVPDAADRCPRVAARTASGCPGATTVRGGRVRLTRTRKGLLLRTGLRASCPAGGNRCSGRVSAELPATKRRGRRTRRSRVALGSRAFSVAPGDSAAVSLVLSSVAERRLRRTRRAARIALKLTGPDGAVTRAQRTARLRPPRRPR